MARLVTLSGSQTYGQRTYQDENLEGWWTDLTKSLRSGVQAITGGNTQTETKPPPNTALWVTVAVLGTVTFGLLVSNARRTRRRRVEWQA